MSYPLVSVIMPAYNAAKYVGEAIESLLHQTYKDIEIIIINDGSTDNTEEIVQKYSENDNRIIYLKNEKNLGISAACNRGIDNAQGKYIARMDADDVCEPTRIEKQAKYMEENPDCGIVGVQFYTFSAESDEKNSNALPIEDKYIKLSGLYGLQFCDASVMLRKSFFTEHNIKYNSEYNCAEGLRLYSDAKYFMKFHNIDEVLYGRRQHSDSVSCKKKQKQFMLSNKIYESAFREIIDEELYVSIFSKLMFTLPEIKESFNILGEVPLMKLKENCPFTREEISYACGMQMQNFIDRINLPNDTKPEKPSAFNFSYAALKEIIDEDFCIPMYENPDDTSVNALKESFRVLSEIPLMKLKKNCPYTRAELVRVATEQRALALDADSFKTSLTTNF